ncbi:hypothetical protein AB0B28_17540 [Glycomyces sp. NPDC046736]|uniref:hypothetical protein n=1 Tax=Glycomyces sp. NPDC046736 TaxID=3155615 RepID=UPI0033F693F0
MTENNLATDMLAEMVRELNEHFTADVPTGWTGTHIAPSADTIEELNDDEVFAIDELLTTAREKWLFYLEMAAKDDDQEGTHVFGSIVGKASLWNRVVTREVERRLDTAELPHL